MSNIVETYTTEIIGESVPTEDTIYSTRSKFRHHYQRLPEFIKLSPNSRYSLHDDMARKAALHNGGLDSVFGMRIITDPNMPDDRFYIGYELRTVKEVPDA